MKIIKINNCHNCPFANNDNEYGHDGCNLKDIKLYGWEELPKNKVHKECPLKQNHFVIKLTKKPFPKIHSERV